MDDNDYTRRWMLIKAGFSRQIPQRERINDSRKAKSERGIWQRWCWEHLIRAERFYERHVDYIHYNLVKHGYVERPVDWPHSSIHQYIKRGGIRKNWGFGDWHGDEGAFGERS